jgi:hypothetical protein
LEQQQTNYQRALAVASLVFLLQLQQHLPQLELIVEDLRGK